MGFIEGLVLGVALGALLGGVAVLLVTRRKAARSVGTGRRDDHRADRTEGLADFAGLLGASPTTPSPADSPLEALRRDLMTKCLHNTTLVNRLIEAERERRPDADLEQLYRSAISRWERDNR